MDFKEQITKAINNKRNIKESTLKAYILNLEKLLKLKGLDVNIKNLNNLIKNKNDIIELLKDKKKTTIRNYLASVVVYVSTLDDKKQLLDEYRELMEEYNKEYKEHIRTNEKSEKQNNNWISIEELQKVLKDYKKELDKKDSLQKEELTKKEFDLLQQYIVGMLYIGDPENPPLRNNYIMDIINSKEYNKLTEEEKTKKNYLVVKNKNNKFFSIGDYKTSGKYGTKTFIVGKILNKALNIWLKYNKTNHLLLNSKNEPLTANGLTKLIKKTFEPTKKNISSSLLRSIYITEKINPMVQKQKALADKMLHSPAVQQSVYNKED